MLQNIELARAMGFSDEESEYEFVGNVTEITKQIGNAVPVRTAAALVKAVLDPVPGEIETGVGGRDQRLFDYQGGHRRLDDAQLCKEASEGMP